MPIVAVFTEPELDPCTDTWRMGVGLSLLEKLSNRAEISQDTAGSAAASGKSPSSVSPHFLFFSVKCKLLMSQQAQWADWEKALVSEVHLSCLVCGQERWIFTFCNILMFKQQIHVAKPPGLVRIRAHFFPLPCLEAFVLIFIQSHLVSQRFQEYIRAPVWPLANLPANTWGTAAHGGCQLSGDKWSKCVRGTIFLRSSEKARAAQRHTDDRAGEKKSFLRREAQWQIWLGAEQTVEHLNTVMTHGRK